jgi:hypothetical protein
MKVAIALALLASCLMVAVWADCNGVPNTIPINTAAPVFLRSTTNGKLYQAGQGDNKFYVAHVYGDAYSMGFAHGSLLKDEIKSIMSKFFTYMDSQVDQYLQFLPKEV